MNQEYQDGTVTWWQSTAFRINRWYAIGVVLATVVAFATPHVLGPFFECAEFMEVEWLAVAFLCMSGIGFLNATFSFAPRIEAVIPKWGVSPLRRLLLVVAPVLILIGTMYLTFSPFWYALLNDPVLLCD